MSGHLEVTSGHDAPSAAAPAPVTLEQAAAILGVSVTMVKRRIRAGVLRAAAARSPHGTVWLVSLPPAATTPAADAMVPLIQTTIRTVLGPLVAELAASR